MPKISGERAVHVRVRHGDPVTCIGDWRRRKASVLIAKVAEVAKGANYFIARPDGSRRNHLFKDEGITWIRGHHAEGSPERDALLAAYALAGPSPLAVPRLDGLAMVNHSGYQARSR